MRGRGARTVFGRHGYKELKDLYHHGYAGSLKSVIEALLNGEVTGEARVLLSSAKLVALRKPNGKLRPIAMGDARYASWR